MQEEIAKILLNGVPLNQFIAFYIAGVIGAVVSYGFNVGMSMKKDATTPKKFSKTHFKVKIWRLVIAVISIAGRIVFNKEILGFVLASDASIELTLWSAVLAGAGWDRFGKAITAKKK